MTTRFPSYVPAGVIPACILPFHDDLSLDLVSFAKHLKDTAAVAGLSAITINAHSTEVASCTLDEQARVAVACKRRGSREVPDAGRLQIRVARLRARGLQPKSHVALIDWLKRPQGDRALARAQRRYG